MKRRFYLLRSLVTASAWALAFGAQAQTKWDLASAYPATIIIRRDGTIDRYHLGPVTAAMLRLMVDEARTHAQG